MRLEDESKRLLLKSSNWHSIWIYFTGGKRAKIILKPRNYMIRFGSWEGNFGVTVE